MKLKVGIVSYGGGVFRYDIPQTYLDQSIERLGKCDIELTAIEQIVLTDKASDDAMGVLKNAQIDMLILQLGTFSMGNNLVKLIKEFEHTPLFVWGFNDPVVEDFPTIPMNSLTVLNMLTSYLHKFGKPFEYAYEVFGDEEVWTKLDTMISALSVKKQLKYAKYAIVGSRVSGFYLSMVDELRFRNEIGPEIVYYAIGSWVNEADKINSSRIEPLIEEIYDTKKVSINKEVVEKNIRLELALHDYIEANGVTAVTIKCWPELQALYSCSACGILSRLNDSGITASCEGDLAGLATMDILQKLTNQTVFFADPVARSSEGALKAWHCGFGPESLANGESKIEYTCQSTMRGNIGIGVQYEMKTGVVSLCKLSEGKDAYRLFCATGYTVKPDRQVLGVQTDIMLDAGFDRVLDAIVTNGIEHHYAIVHADIVVALKALQKWIGIELIIVN
jgi:L-fucose isomerase-like protein